VSTIRPFKMTGIYLLLFVLVCVHGDSDPDPQFSRFRGNQDGDFNNAAQPRRPQVEVQEDLPEEDFHTSVEELCEGRQRNEYFRLSVEDCREVVRCDRAGIAGSIRLAKVKCPSGLFFDLERQTCDWRNKVDNCDRLSQPRLLKPNLYTETPVCPDGRLQCHDGECISRALFCDKKPDCVDGTDENACSVEEDPNRADVCDPAQCLLPECFCSADGTAVPGVVGGHLELDNVPMMININFNGAVNQENIKIYEKLFHSERLNPNGCTAKATFFVSHKYSDYSAIQELHRKGHEIGVFSITNHDDSNYWTKGTYDTWLAEMAGARLIIERFANITDGTVIGVRAPYLRVGGNDQFTMMTDQFFAYDSSISAPLGRVPIWPYTMDYRMPHKCHGNAGNCPSRSHPGIWEMPINELDRRDDPEFDEDLTGCHLVSSCSNIYHKDQFRLLLQTNFERHYSSNKAPLSLAFDPSWLISNKGFTAVVGEWMEHLLTTYTDVYFVTQLQVIQWMQNPTGSQNMREFEEWKGKCVVEGQPMCSIPNPCPLDSRELPGETNNLHTCVECPSQYPWIQDPTGDGFTF